MLGLLALCSLLGEGAAGGWSAVYLHDNLGTSAAFAALGYAAFSVTMATGRLFGDRLAARFGPARLISGCGLVAAIGLAGVLVTASPAAGLIGFALFGAGLSSTFPQLLSVAGNVETSRSGTGIARVAGAGYLGMLSGPVLIGSAASLVGLRLALGIPLAAALFLAGGGWVVTDRRGRLPGGAAGDDPDQVLCTGRMLATARTSRSRPNSKSASKSRFNSSADTLMTCGNSAGFREGPVGREDGRVLAQGPLRFEAGGDA